VAAVLALSAVVLTFALLGYAIRRGFVDGDVEADVAVRLNAVADGLDGIRGWVSVEVENPGAGAALVGLALSRPRATALCALRHLDPVTRRTLGRRHKVDLESTEALGAVPAGEKARFELELPPAGNRAPTELVALVGTRGRLRLHRIALRDLTPLRHESVLTACAPTPTNW